MSKTTSTKNISESDVLDLLKKHIFNKTQESNIRCILRKEFDLTILKIITKNGKLTFTLKNSEISPMYDEDDEEESLKPYKRNFTIPKKLRT
tara:strand:- start:4801 stop:5076 length:276 start_codon:yes stop_codon:yes gene_type:complete